MEKFKISTIIFSLVLLIETSVVVDNTCNGVTKDNEKTCTAFTLHKMSTTTNNDHLLFKPINIYNKFSI